MNDEEFKRFAELENVLQFAQMVCPPDEYYKRQRLLLHALAGFALTPYYIELEKRRAESKED